MAALSSILIICFAITPYCMGSDTPDLTQDFLQNICPSNWFNAGEKGCFFFAKDASIADWEEAQNYCKNLESGAWLAEIHDQETWTMLSDQGKSINPNLDWWLGASDKDEEGVWKWQRTGSLFKYKTNWSVGDGKSSPQDCLQLYRQNDLKWDDVECHNGGPENRPLCQIFSETLEFLNEIDQNQYGNENASASANVVINKVFKTFRSAIETLIDECKNSIRKLEFIYEKDKNQEEKEDLNGNIVNRTIAKFIYEKDKNQQEKEDLNGNIANRTITGVIEAVIDESENSVSEDFPTFVEGIIFALLLFPLGFIFVPLFAAGWMLVVMSVIMFALPFLIISSIFFALFLFPLGVI